MQGKCSAQGVLCFKCGKANHKAKVCRSKKKTNAAIMIAAVATSKKVSTSLARLAVIVGVGFIANPQIVDVIPDTGAEVTVAGESHLLVLGIKTKHLVAPPSDLQHVAGGLIDVLGCCYLSFCVNNRSIVERVYFIANVKSIFLSLSALKKFGIVHEDFPQPIEPNHSVQVSALSEVGVAREHGNKPHGAVKESTLQESPPTAGGSRTLELTPTAGGKLSSSPQECIIPYPPIEDNIPLLREWLVNEFKADVFNEDRIPFPAMKGVDVHIHLVDKDVTPYAVHTPSSVPFHLEEAVTELLKS